jgi:uncharacterized protein YndB with AHSA1/START domain
MPRSLAVTTPSPTEIRVVRSFDAPARLIFDCHTKADLVRRWLTGTEGWSMPVCEIDLRVGGAFRYVWRNDQSGFEFGARGIWKEIVAPTRLVHTEHMDGFEGELLCTYSVTEESGRTTLTVTMQFVSEAARDGALATGMTDGMRQCYDRLDDLMKEKVA